MKIFELFAVNELDPGERPVELGDAYFYFNGKLVDISPYRNHRDWLIGNAEKIGLPEYVHENPTKALFESYKLGWIRLVWDKGGKWDKGKAAQQGNSLYINGIDKIIWKNMQGFMNQHQWAGNIDVLVIEYLDIVGGKPKWNRTDIFNQNSLGAEGFDNLYRGRKPKRSLAPANAVLPHYAQESFNANRRKNLENDG